MYEQMNLFDFTMPEIHIDKPIRVISLFSGYGSPEMALKRIGAEFEHYRVVEFDKYAVESYNAVHGTDFKATDIRDVHAEDLGIVDTDKYAYLMTFSFPCQDISAAGKQKGLKKGSGTRSGLLWEVERILTEIKDSGGEFPQILFLENVSQLVGKKFMPDFMEWNNFLESLGYKNYWQILNAKDYGVPQNRERVFEFSFLGEYSYNFPQPIPLEIALKDVLEDEVDEKYYIKSEKAQKLIDSLIERGELDAKAVERGGIVNPDSDLHKELNKIYKEGNKIPVDLTVNEPTVKEVANCITAREDRGISNQRSMGNGVVEWEK